jgi:hypothetical protein
LHVSTTYRFNKDPEKLVEAKDCDVSRVRENVDVWFSVSTVRVEADLPCYT